MRRQSLIQLRNAELKALYRQVFGKAPQYTNNSWLRSELWKAMRDTDWEVPKGEE